MDSRTCTLCLRAIQKQARTIPLARETASRLCLSRSFTTSARRYIMLPEPNATPATSIPPVAPLRADGGSKSKTDKSPTRKLAEKLATATGSSETYTAYGATELLYKKCARQADYSIPQAGKDNEEMPKTADGEDLGIGDGWWHTELGLKPTFSTWSQVTMLHMYLLSVRFRCFEADVAQPWQQHLLDHFFFDAENKMTINHNMHARGTRNKYLKDMYIQWRGLLAAYDEGLAKGDAVLAAAVWRNVFKANENVDILGLGQIVCFMRNTLKALDSLSDEKIKTVIVEFGHPGDESKVVKLRSSMMDIPFERAPGKDLPTGGTILSPGRKTPPVGQSSPVAKGSRK